MTTPPARPSPNSVGWQDGTHEREDLPGYIAAGVSYFILPGTLRIEPNFTYYFEKQAKFEGARFQDSNPGNSYDLGVALEYILNPQWRFSVGYLHTEIQGMKSQDLLPEAPELDANSVAVGLVYSPIERLSLTLGGERSWYDSVKTDSDFFPGAGPHPVRQGCLWRVLRYPVPFLLRFYPGAAARAAPGPFPLSPRPNAAALRATFPLRQPPERFFADKKNRFQSALAICYNSR